jgi:predicted MPP superfamily phosphohydrolase
MFHLMFGLPCAYVVARFVLPLAWPAWTTAMFVLLLVTGSQFHLWSRLSSGSVFSPEFPRGLVLAFNVAFGAILFLALLQLFVDVGALTIGLVRGSSVIIPSNLRLSIGILALALALIGVVQAARLPEIRQVDVEVPDLPPQFEGYRILQLTDLHSSRLFPTSWVDKVVTMANGLDADLVAITGDLIDGTVDARRADVSPFRRLTARDGVWAIPGNHEYFFGAEDWMEHIRSLGIRTLENEHTVIDRDGAILVLAGVTDLSAPETGRPGPDLAHALTGARAGSPVVLLDHQPTKARLAAEAGVALQLSGHTHGGMILGFHRLLALANGGFVSGLYRVGDMALYVSNGTGIWPGFALRLGKPSEMTMIRLHGTNGLAR